MTANSCVCLRTVLRISSAGEYVYVICLCNMNLSDLWIWEMHLDKYTAKLCQNPGLCKTINCLISKVTLISSCNVVTRSAFSLIGTIATGPFALQVQRKKIRIPILPILCQLTLLFSTSSFVVFDMLASWASTGSCPTVSNEACHRLSNVQKDRWLIVSQQVFWSVVM